jgi:hypothetical protein
MNRYFYAALGGAIAAVLVVSPVSAQSLGEPVNKAPTKADWAALADQPDLSGVWTPGPLDKYPPGNTTEPQWLPAIQPIYERLKQLDAQGRPQNIWVNCLPEGLPSSWTQTLNSVEFLQTPGRITILGELDGNRQRRIWLDGRPHPVDPDPTFSGHSIGHWERQTLVIDTVGFLPEVFISTGQGVGIPNNGDMHVVERITLTGPDTARVDLVVDAPKVLARPWKASRLLNRHRERRFDLAESSCRQGDFIEGQDKDGLAIFLPLPKDEGGATLPLELPKKDNR